MGRTEDTDLTKWAHYLNPNAKRVVFIVAGLIADYHAWHQGSHVSKTETNSLRTFMNI